MRVSQLNVSAEKFLGVMGVPILKVAHLTFGHFCHRRISQGSCACGVLGFWHYWRRQITDLMSIVRADERCAILSRYLETRTKSHNPTHTLHAMVD